MSLPSLTSYINNLTWNSNAANASDWRAVTWGGPTGNKKFAAVAGTTITGLSKVAVSKNGYEWTSTVDTPVTIFATQCNKVLWNSVYNRFFVGGQGTNTLGFSRSESGLSWVGLGSSGNGVGFINTSVNSLASNNKSLRLVAVGKGTNSIAYSDAALPLTGTWTPVTGNTIFSDQGNAVLWFAFKNIWIAVGQGTNTIATSPDGITWTGRGNSVFSVAGYGVVFNPTKAIAFGQGTNTVAYSLDGISWYGLGSTVFSTAMYGAVWTGTLWHGVGQGTNTMAYSYDGIYWLGVGSNIFTVAGYSITWVNWAGIVAVGEGTNTLAQTSNGVTWNGLGSNMFSVAGYGIATNGIQLVAVGKGTNTIIYSNNGLNWFPTGSNVFTDSGYSIAWSGTNWVALGSGTTNTAAYSPDGIVWTGLGNLFTTLGRGIYAKTPEIVVVGTGTSTGNNIAYSPNGIWFWLLNALMSSLTFTSVLSVSNNGSTSAPFWVAGGQSTPTLAYSSDGFSWTSLGTSVFSMFCTGVAYGNGTWVAVGSGTNGLAWSTNGTGWNGLFQTFFTTGNGVAYAANSATNKWVAVGGGTNTVAYSTNGRTWTGAGSPIFSSLGQGVANNNLTGASNRWVAVGQSGGTADSIGYSDNVTSWTATGRAVFIGSIAASSTTLTVASVSLGTITVGMEITGTGIAPGTRIVAYNAALDYWTVNKAIASSVTAATITGRIFFTGYGVAHNGKNDSASFLGEINGTTLTVNGPVTGTIVVGMGLTGTGVEINTVIVSGSGTSWTVNISHGTIPIPETTITGNTGRWAAVGQGSTTEGGNTIAYSNDGILWNGLGTTIFTQQGRCVTYSADLGIWVAGGYSIPVPSFFSFSYSYDGVNWTGVPDSPKILSQVYGVSWNGAYFIASGNNSSNTVVFAYSLNGINWFGYGGYSSITNGANDVAYNEDQNTWVSVGNATSANSICFSPNGVNWIGLGNTIFTTVGNGVTWKGSPVNKWVAVGAGTVTRFADSPDGLNWTSRGFGPLDTTALKVIYTDNKFVAVGQGSFAAIANSPDGISWTGVSGSLGITSVGRGLGYDAANNRVVAVGTRGDLIFTTTGFGVGYGGSDSAIFTGSIASTTLTVSFIMSGAISVGMTLTGTGVTPGTTISAGSGLSWTITPSQTVASIQMTGTRDDTVSFTGSITGTSLVVNSVTSGTVLLGMTVTGTGVVPGTVISAGSSSPYTVSISQNTATFTGTINNGSGSAGNILTVTSNLSGTILIGTTVTGGSTAVGTVIISGSGNTWTVSGAAQLVSSTTLTTGAFAGDCVFDGTITGNALSVTSVTSGFLIIGMRLTGVGVSANTLIVSGSGTNWTVSTSQNVTTTITGTFSQMLTGTSGLFVAGGNGTNTLAYSGTGKIWAGLGTTSPATPFTTLSYGAAFNAGAVGSATFNAIITPPSAVFTGTISGTTLTVTSLAFGTVAVGNLVSGTGVATNTLITSGSGTWTVNNSQTITPAVTMRGTTPNATFTGTISGTTLTITSLVSGTVATGMIVNGAGVVANTVITAGAGASWTVSNSQTVTPAVFMTGTTPNATFTSTISGTTLTITSLLSGTVAIGMNVTGAGVVANTFITSGSGTSWQVNNSQTVTPAVTMRGTTPSGTFTGTISGTTLTINSLVSGIVATSMIVNGTGLAANTIITSGPTWTVNNSQTVTPAVTMTGTVPSATFTGTIAGNTLTINTLVLGTVAIGMLVSGTGVSTNTFITAGSGLSWTVNNSQTVTPAVNMTATNPNATFTGTISGTTLTINSLVSGTVSIGMLVIGSGVATNTFITTGSGTSWTVNNFQTVTPAVTMTGTTTTLTIDSGLVGTIQVGMGVTGAGVTLGTVILSGSGTTWILNVSSTVGAVVAMRGSMNRWVGVGNGTNTLAYSNDGINWVGAGNSIISGGGYQAVYSPMVLLTGGTGGVSSTVLTVTSVDQGYLYTGMPVAGTGIAAGTTILNQLTNTGLQPWTTGTYTMSTANTITNGTLITGGNVWVAAGQSTNSIAYSLNNGVTWLGVGTTMLTNRGAGVAFGGPTGQKKFVAVGLSTQLNGNCIAYSTNGVVWQGVQNSGYLFSTACNGVAYGGAAGQEKFVAVGQGTNTFAYSFDGVTWIAAGGAPVSLIGYSVLWSSTKQIWLAGVNSPTAPFTPNGYAYSYDGIVWYGASAPANYSNIFSCNGLSYGKGVFVSVNNSSFGYLTYADEENANSLGDFNWVPIGFNSLGVSNDGGSTWSGVTRINVSLLTGNTVAYNGTKWIAGGTGSASCALLYSDSTAKIWGTFGGAALYNVKWFPSISQFLLSLNGAGITTTVTRAASSQIARSSDGVDWTWCDMGAINNMAFTTVAGTPTTLVFGSFAERMSPPLIVCCGRSSMSNSLNASMVLRSTDGVTWTRNIYPFQTSFILYVPFAVNPRFMVLSGNFINTSSDAVTWTPTRLFDDRMNATAAAWAPNLSNPSLSKVCVISNATNYSVNNAAVSSDGITWEYGTIPGNSFTALEWSPDLAIFCALLNTDRNQQECLISGDGKNWYNTNSLNTNNSFNGLVWSPELQVFCGMGYNTVARPYGYVSKLLQ